MKLPVEHCPNTGTGRFVCLDIQEKLPAGHTSLLGELASSDQTVNKAYQNTS